MKYNGLSTQEAVIMEMTADGSDSFDVPVDRGIIDKVSEGDSDPMFVTIEVLNEGISRNGRSWDKETIFSVADQILSKQPDGYYGHLTEDERHNKYPEPQTIWLGARVAEVNGKLRLFAKGYVLPDAKVLRTYLRKAKAIGKNVAVSVYGTAKAIKDTAKGIIHMQDFDLESIDWARPGSEGVRNMGLFTVTSEMTDDSTKNLEGDEMKREDAIKSASADELKELNPVVSEMFSEVEAKESELSTVVSEMTDIKSALGLAEDQSAATVVSEMKSRLFDLEMDSALREKVESPSARKVVKQLVVSEMTASDTVEDALDRVLSSETGKAVVAEMLETAPRVAPLVEAPSASTRKFTTKG